MKLILLGFFLFATWTAQAQMRNGLYGNEWINTQQTYYKIKIHEDGLYRIPASVLQASGLNLSALASGFSLHRMGISQPLYVHAPNGQVEYVEFYGAKNRGDLDANLYTNLNHHVNPKYSLISDTSTYFLSWSATTTGNLMANRAADLSNLPTVESRCRRNSELVFNDVFSEGKTYPSGGVILSKSSMEYGEGYVRALAASHSLSVPTQGALTSGSDASLRFSFYAPVYMQHNLEALVGSQSVVSRNFMGDSVGQVLANVPASRLSNGTSNLLIRGNNGSNDRYYLGFASLSYWASFDFGGASELEFELEANGQRQFIQIQNVNATNGSSQPFYVYDLTNRVRIQAFWDGTRLSLDLPAATAGSMRRLWFCNQSVALRTVGRMQAWQFRNFTQEMGDYVIVKHASLENDGQGGNPILQYAAYRASTGFSPIVIDIEELNNQFAYGQDMHPLALRNFAAYALARWTSLPPRYLFLIGKGRPYVAARTVRPADLLIQTSGYPPSDNVMLAPLGTDAPMIPVGRLAVTTGAQVATYLTKIRDVETWGLQGSSTLADRAWFKQVLHLGGGANSIEQNAIRNSLNNMKASIEAPNFGGQVYSFFKNSSSPIQAAQSAYLDSLINGGVSLLTFFGHSSANSFDFNLDYPENYRNYRKYPLLMALGCYGGTIWEPQQAISERFVLEDEAGSVVFLASVGAASLNGLADFGENFYRNLSGASYGLGAGHAVQAAIRQIQGTFRYSTYTQMAYQYMTYHGDPAFGLNMQPKPDYYLDASLLSHEPSAVTTQMQDFELVIDLRNLGRAVDTVFQLEITREFPDGSQVFVLSQQVQAPYHADTLRLVLPVGGAQALGINYFTVTLDALSQIDEGPAPAAEQNNQALRYAIPIGSEAILPVYPYEFAVVPYRNIELRASTGNALAPSQTYIFQIDTTAYFNSPLKREGRVTQGGGVVAWTPTGLNYQDSVVYYWRVSRDSTSAQNSYLWAASSFIFLDGSFPGWNQSHFFQFKRDYLQTLNLEEPSREFEFQSSVQEIFLRNGFTPNPLNPELFATYINGGLFSKCLCPTRNGVFVQVINPNDLSFWTLAGGATRYGAINCDANPNRSSTMFLFQTAQPAARTALESFLRDTVPAGHYVLLYSLNDGFPQLFQPSLLSLLDAEGAWFLNDWVGQQGQVPYAFFYEKGDSTFTGKRSVIGGSSSDIIELSGLVPGNWDNGFMRSTRIGPAAAWNSLHWRYAQDPTGDVLRLDLYGIDSSGLRRLLVRDVQSLDTLIGGISAQQYPHLELEWYSKDSVQRSSPQLLYWRILADELPEAALNPALSFVFESDTLAQGQTLRLRSAMSNIGRIDMDSMLVKVQILGSSQGPQYARFAPLPVGDSLGFSAELETANLSGPQQLFVEINPNNDQAEQFHFNNLALIPFYVDRDKINPLLDVTFDGQRILNGDLVSAKPEIQITLRDDNKYLALNKLEDFTLILRHPELPNGELALDPTTTDVEFYPADTSNLSQNNEARLLLRPILEHDGTYTLYVSAKDRSGNNSGALNYSVEFEVLNQTAISNVFNYPNPFTTQTQFVFTLTGSELPDEMMIQIYTIRGVLVREIRKDELGPLRIGLNRTEYAWDGRDAYGQRLANGVYLYRVQARKGGQAYDLYRGRKDYLFKNGFGKMYLMH